MRHRNNIRIGSRSNNFNNCFWARRIPTMMMMSTERPSSCRYRPYHRRSRKLPPPPPQSTQPPHVPPCHHHHYYPHSVIPVVVRPRPCALTATESIFAMRNVVGMGTVRGISDVFFPFVHYFNNDNQLSLRFAFVSLS